MRAAAAPGIGAAVRTLGFAEAADSAPSRESEENLRPHAPRAVQTQTMTNYTVQDGDTLWTLAGRWHLRLSTLQRLNALRSPDDLTVGQVLMVPPEDGVLATAHAGDTVSAVAARYGVGPEPVAAFNGLRPDDLLTPGVALFVPSGQEESTAVIPNRGGQRTATGHFIWPAPGMLTQGFWRWHQAIDVANGWGTNLAAADSGRGIWSGWGDYGIYVQIDHGNGFSTLYGHMARSFVSVGQWVDRGHVIGLMGSTGRSTGPHVHFAIHYQGIPQDPIRYLP